MPLRRFSGRLTIEFTVDVNSITEDAAHDYAAESGEADAASDPKTWEWIGLQRRLLHALVSRPDLLRQYVMAEARGVVSEEAGQWVYDAFGYGDEDHSLDAVWTAIGELSEADQLAFVRSAEAGTLIEDGDLVWRAFRCQPTDVRLDVGSEGSESSD